MNNDEIEEIAVHHMQGLLLGNKNLKADFATGDKKPIIEEMCRIIPLTHRGMLTFKGR